MDTSTIHILTFPDNVLTITGLGQATTVFRRDKARYERTYLRYEPLILLTPDDAIGLTDIEQFVCLEALRSWFCCSLEGKQHSAYDHAMAHGLGGRVEVPTENLNPFPAGWREEFAKAEATLLYVRRNYLRLGYLNGVLSAMGTTQFRTLATGFVNTILT